MLYHQAASAVGGERIRLRELCLKMGWASLNKNPYYPCLKLPRFVLEQGKDWTLRDWWKPGQFSGCSCLSPNKGMSNKLTPMWTNISFCPSFFRYILSVWYFVCQCVCACLFTVCYCIHKVFCACALTLSQEIKGWTASGQVIQNTDDDCSSVWK